MLVAGNDSLTLEDRLLYQIIRTSGPSPQDWLGLEQEITLQLWRSFPNYDNRFKLSSWVYRIAFNVTATEFRKSSRRHKHEQTRAEMYV